MRIESHQNGYRIVPSKGAVSAVVRASDQVAHASPPSEGRGSLRSFHDVDRAELTSLPQADAALDASATDASLDRIRDRLVAGRVDRPIDLARPGGSNRVLNRAYFLSEQSAAERNSSAVGLHVDVRG